MKNTIQSHRLSPSDAKFLKGRHDILTYEEFEPGMSVVICQNCKMPHLESTWSEHQDGPQCYNCGCTESKQFDITDFTENTVHIKRSVIKIRTSSKGIYKRFEGFFRLIKRMNLIDMLFDLTQSIVVFRVIAIVLFIIASSTTAILHSQSKMPYDNMNEKRAVAIEQFVAANDSVLNAFNDFNIGFATNNFRSLSGTQHMFEHTKTANSQLINKIKQTFTFTKTSVYYSQSTINDVNCQVEVWIKFIFKWIEDL